MNLKLRALTGLAMMSIIATACGTGGATTTPTAAGQSPAESAGAGASTEPSAPPASLDTTPVTIKVWDYYGDSTPVKPALEGFAKEFPWITVDYEALDWDSMNEKFTAGIGAGEVPDMATLDMTWLPTLAANGALEDLTSLSGGMLNGQPIADQYTQGAQDAMHFNDQLIAMLYDFDTYALYYRKDLFDQKGIAVPTNWDELRAAAKQLAEASKSGGKLDRYLTAIRPNSFHFSQYLYQDGGALLNDANTQAVFNSDAGVNAVNIQKAILDDGSGKYWPDADGDLTPAIKSGEVAMFQDGPYYMGLLKTGVPEQSGKWAVAGPYEPAERTWSPERDPRPLVRGWLNGFVLAARAGVAATFPRERLDDRWPETGLLIVPAPLTSTSSSLHHLRTSFWRGAGDHFARGGSLWLSVSADAALPEMADLAGCHLADRAPADRPGVLRFVRPWGPFATGDELALPDGDGTLATRWARLAVDDAEVVAVDPDGGPGLVVARRGWGVVATCAAPVELLLAAAPGSHGPADRSPGLYAGLIALAGIRETAGVDHPDVTTGSLSGPDGGALVATNHAPSEARITVRLPAGATAARAYDHLGAHPLPTEPAGADAAIEVELPAHGATLIGWRRPG